MKCLDKEKPELLLLLAASTFQNDSFLIILQSHSSGGLLSLIY